METEFLPDLKKGLCVAAGKRVLFKFLTCKHTHGVDFTTVTFFLRKKGSTMFTETATKSLKYI